MHGDGKIKNKQISVNDILEFSKNLEEYKKGWENLVSDEQEKLKYISKYRKYHNFEAHTSYSIKKKDGEELNRKNDYEWFVNNIRSVDEIENLYVYFSFGYLVDRENGFNRNSAGADVRIYPHRKEGWEKVSLNVSSNFDDSDTTTYFENLKKITQYYNDTTENMSFDDIIKVVKIIESLKENWMTRNEDDEAEYKNTPDRKKRMHLFLQI